MDRWTKLAFFLLLGYSLFGRSFAYIGIPPAKIFIGDVALVVFIVFNQRAFIDKWISALTRRLRLSALSWVLLISMMYGLWELVYGIMSGNDPITALQILVFNVYPLYFFLGLWAGVRRPDLLKKYVRICAWYTAIYGPICIAFVNQITIMIPGTDVPILSTPGSGSGSLLALLSLEANPARFWFPIAMCAFMTLAMQVRADWVGLMVGFAIWGVLEKKLSRLFLIMGLLVSLLVIGFIADIHIYNPARGSDVSTKEILGRAISGIDPELAHEYSNNSAIYAGTVEWRQNWWKAIREAVAKTPTTFLFGLGYGYPIKDLVPYLKGMDIRTPHSVFYFALSYSGVVGVTIFAALQCCLLRLMWLVYKKTGQSFGLANWSCVLISALFGNVFETPGAAIPLYLLSGLCVAPLFVSSRRLRMSPEVPVPNAPSPMRAPGTRQLSPAR